MSLSLIANNIPRFHTFMMKPHFTNLFLSNRRVMILRKWCGRELLIENTYIPQDIVTFLRDKIQPV
jgi:hypothetical protein